MKHQILPVSDSFMTSPRPIVVFDLDGTLADTLPDLAHAVNFATATRGLPPVGAPEIANMAGQGLKMMLKQAFQINNTALDEPLLDTLFEVALAEYTSDVCAQSDLFDGAEKSLELFLDNGWLLAVCTNKPVGLAKRLLEELGHSNKFASICGADSFDFKKPDARHLLETIASAGAHPNHAVMVGDTHIDFETAKNANIPVIAVDFGYSGEPVANYNPEAIISHFDALYETATRLVPPKNE